MTVFHEIPDLIFLSGSDPLRPGNLYLQTKPGVGAFLKAFDMKTYQALSTGNHKTNKSPFLLNKRKLHNVNQWHPSHLQIHFYLFRDFEQQIAHALPAIPMEQSF